MGTKTKIVTGIGIMIILLIGVWGIYPPDPLTVVYATPEEGNPSVENPLPPYAYLENEVLVVDISSNNPFYPGEGDGLSVNTTYVFEGVFTIENNQSETGYDEICVRISSKTPKIGFFVDDFEGSWSEVIEVTLQADENVNIGVWVDTHGLPLGDYSESITIEAWGGSCG
ncbi:DUF1102 domain-containing protein [Thermococcus radiotolerans]|uniref:DUF1102 domain-containing protein n=1 Tax=Thermococcus radiotolerans TaxID=187880 RepID=A0A2Z2N354_9EURY|nr:DUF1102 domain-containing protein [Thermococcus radiotolerans]ASJ15437.1 hypothetical protein A3L10_09965 [Thermococcus radiotolerans]